MGEWYEIARIPSLNKRHLSGVREDYRMNNDNRSFTVVTTAHNDRRSKPFSARGVITRPRGEIGGKLKASYFKPVTSAYNIFDVDNDYKYALVGTNNLNSLWVLSRDRSITPEIKLRFLRKATTMGFKTSRLIWCY